MPVSRDGAPRTSCGTWWRFDVLWLVRLSQSEVRNQIVVCAALVGQGAKPVSDLARSLALTPRRERYTPERTPIHSTLCSVPAALLGCLLRLLPTSDTRPSPRTAVAVDPACGSCHPPCPPSLAPAATVTSPFPVPPASTSAAPSCRLATCLVSYTLSQAGFPY
jgi:hypothetical protein